MLATLSALKSFLNISGTEADTFLTDCLKYATGIIHRYVGRQIEATDYDEYYDGTASNFVILNEYPIVSVSLLKSGDTMISSDDYKIYQEKGIIKLTSGYFTRGDQNIQVQYRGGYETVPEELALVCVEIAALIYRDSGVSEGRLGRASLNLREGGTVQYVRRLPEYFQNILKSYRRVSIG